MMRLILTLLFVASVSSKLGPATERVDLELVLLVDASNSIDDAELQFQRQGYGDALVHPDVLDAIRSGPVGRIAVTFMEWADENNQDIVVPWSAIDGLRSAERFRKELLRAKRMAFGANAIGDAIAAANSQFPNNQFEGYRKIIDFSGDSANNWGGVPIAEARNTALDSGVTINGLAILCLDDDCGGRPVSYDLEEAFKTQIIAGPGSFVITVDSRKSFADAVRRKLVLELSNGRPRRGNASKQT